MDEARLGKIKKAVRTNFEASSDTYVKFEEQHGFFQRLNSVLVNLMSLPPGCRILDVGCGTGASCRQMVDSISGCTVVGIDNSRAMLDAARVPLGQSDRIALIHGDAAALRDYLEGSFDAVIYSASIFLIPDFRESLKQALELLEPRGVLGMTFMDGLYDENGRNLLAQADIQAKQGVSLRKPVALTDLISFLNELFPCVQQKTEDFELQRDMLQDFFSVPAMSAGLFPGFAYEARLEKVTRLFEHLPESKMLFRWVLLVAKTA